MPTRGRRVWAWNELVCTKSWERCLAQVLCMCQLYSPSSSHPFLVLFKRGLPMGKPSPHDSHEPARYLTKKGSGLNKQMKPSSKRNIYAHTQKGNRFTSTSFHFEARILDTEKKKKMATVILSAHGFWSSLDGLIIVLAFSSFSTFSKRSLNCNEIPYSLSA